jgi:hypothetical protein
VTDEFRDILRVLLELSLPAGKQALSAEKDGTTELFPDKLKSNMQHSYFDAVSDFISTAPFIRMAQRQGTGS